MINIFLFIQINVKLDELSQIANIPEEKREGTKVVRISPIEY